MYLGEGEKARGRGGRRENVKADSPAEHRADPGLVPTTLRA